jgi:hypothetical protein
MSSRSISIFDDGNSMEIRIVRESRENEARMRESAVRQQRLNAEMDRLEEIMRSVRATIEQEQQEGRGDETPPSHTD